MPATSTKTFFKNENIRVNVGGETVLYEIASDNHFNMIFFLSPNIILQADDLTSETILAKNTYALQYSSTQKNALLLSKNQAVLDFLHIQMEYSYVSNLINPKENIENDRILDQMTKNQFILIDHAHSPKITVEMHMIIKEITGSSKKGVFQKLLIEAKIIKLLMLIFEQFSRKKMIAESENTAQLSKNFIDRFYTKPISAEDIAIKFGYNESKIRSEFKSEFNITIAEYINQLRMLKAKKMIISKKYLIKEIALECGYEYVPNFSRAFKKKFGISPDTLRNS